MTLENNKKSTENSVNKLVVFEDKKIRRTFHEGEWYFSIIDIMEVLAESSNPRRYWSDLKTQLTDNEGFFQLYGKIVQLNWKTNQLRSMETENKSSEQNQFEMFAGEGSRCCEHRNRASCAFGI